MNRSINIPPTNAEAIQIDMLSNFCGCVELDFIATPDEVWVLCPTKSGRDGGGGVDPSDEFRYLHPPIDR